MLLHQPLAECIPGCFKCNSKFLATKAFTPLKCPALADTFTSHSRSKCITIAAHPKTTSVAEPWRSAALSLPSHEWQEIFLPRQASGEGWRSPSPAPGSAPLYSENTTNHENIHDIWSAMSKVSVGVGVGGGGFER